MANWYVATTGSDSTGTGSSGNPYRTIAKALSVYAGSDTIYVASGVVETITAAIVPLAGTAASLTRLLGTDASWNELADPASAASFPQIVMNNTTANVIDATNNYFRVRNFVLDGGAGASKAARCFNGQGTNVGIKNCVCKRYSDFGALHQGTGIISQVWATGGVSGCRQGIRNDGPCVQESAVTGSAGPGILSGGDAVNCLVINCSGGSSHGVELWSSGCGRNLVCWGNGGDGILFSWGGGATSIRNAITGNNTGYGIHSTGATLSDADADYNALYNNTAGARNGIPAGAHDQALTADPFVASAGAIASLADVFANFALSPSGADFASKLKGKGYPAYLDPGAMQHQDSGGGGGSGGVSLARLVNGC